MRTAGKDLALLRKAGVWTGERDMLMNAVILLCIHAKREHKPLGNLHNLASAVEDGDSEAAEKSYSQLRDEVAQTLQKYPDIVGTLKTMAGVMDETIEQIPVPAGD